MWGETDTARRLIVIVVVAVTGGVGSSSVAIRGSLSTAGARPGIGSGWKTAVAVPWASASFSA